MRRMLFTRRQRILAIGLLVTPMLAMAPAPDKTSKATLSVQGAADLLDGIAAVNAGYDRIVKDGAAEHVVKQPYQLGGMTRFALARDIVALRPIVAAYQEAHNGKINELSEGKGEIKKGSPEAATMMAEDTKMLGMKQEVQLAMISLDELKLDVNPVPPGVLSSLMPILVDAHPPE